MPFSISSLASCCDSFDRSLCDQVWLPIVWPAASTCLRISGAHIVCSPIGKKTALVHCAASAANTSCVLCGQGPSSKVSTTSPGCRKSYCLKCSKPNPGPPVVSISTVREMPSALGLAQLADAGVAGAGMRVVGTGTGTAAGARGGVAVWAAATGAAVGAIGAMTGASAGGAGAGITTFAAVGCLVVGALAITLGLAGGAGASAGTEATIGVVVARCASTAPKTATQTTMASAQAAAAKRMASAPQFNPKPSRLP